MALAETTGKVLGVVFDSKGLPILGFGWTVHCATMIIQQTVCYNCIDFLHVQLWTQLQLQAGANKADCQKNEEPVLRAVEQDFRPLRDAVLNLVFRAYPLHIFNWCLRIGVIFVSVS